MKEYNKITSENIRKLRDICTDNAVIYEDLSALQAYSHDEAGGSFYAHMPQAVVKPCSSEQVSQIVRFAASQNIPITPRGAGSGLAGACVPLYGGIVLSLERMNKILEIDTQNMVAVVEPGVVTNDLCKKAQEKGLYYAGYPMSVHSSFIGGNVATNAGGSKVIKYGNTSHHVLGL
ncbi:MAG TPA: FAD-binding oxidoreductase, partial [Petrotogaceae bacterium]|nr:FAD-binding oxidoreductase [Petrotogaceae bacterium]